MKKSGFTLAEVLITLGIIGVVAALTAPALVLSSRNQANAARLSVIVSNLETALQNMIIQEDADNIYGTAFVQAGNNTARAGQLGRYLNINGLAADSVTLANFYANTGGPFLLAAGGGRGAQTSFTGNQGQGGVIGNDAAIIPLKQGGTIFLHRAAGNADEENEQAKAAAANSGFSLVSRAFNLIVDVNGTSGPNIIGRDIFAFIIGGNGRLYAYGSRDTSREGFFGANSNQPCPPEGNNGDFGWSCTAKIIEDGYQMNY